MRAVVIRSHQLGSRLGLEKDIDGPSRVSLKRLSKFLGYEHLDLPGTCLSSLSLFT